MNNNLPLLNPRGDQIGHGLTMWLPVTFNQPLFFLATFIPSELREELRMPD